MLFFFFYEIKYTHKKKHENFIVFLFIVSIEVEYLLYIKVNSFTFLTNVNFFWKCKSPSFEEALADLKWIKYRIQQETLFKSVVFHKLPFIKSIHQEIQKLNQQILHFWDLDTLVALAHQPPATRSLLIRQRSELYFQLKLKLQILENRVVSLEDTFLNSKNVNQAERVLQGKYAQSENRLIRLKKSLSYCSYL